MKLHDLLQFDRVVIQCHNDPDADAIASGFGVWAYLRSAGKDAAFIYGGRNPIRKSNLLLMVERLEIPISHVQCLEAEPDLLLMVDCQPGERNVQAFSAKKTAAIDHHASRGKGLPGLWGKDIRDNYGACATIVWSLLREERGFRLEDFPGLATALYYGLFMDTGGMQEIYHLKDRAMRDELEPLCGRYDLKAFKSNNLSRSDLLIVSEALSESAYHQDCRFIIAQAAPCDANLLGIISDQLIQVEGVDVCAAFCMLPGGAKLSIRSCTKENRANDLARYLANGGGHEEKAGGFLPLDALGISGLPVEEQEDAVLKLLWGRMEGYFKDQDILYAGTGQDTDLSQEALYQKKPVRIGYIRAMDVYPCESEQTNIKIRMLEGDRIVAVTEDLYLIVGIENEVYTNSWDKLTAYNTLTQDPLQLSPEALQDVEDAVSAVNTDARPLAGHIRACTPKHSFIRARKLSRRTKVFQKGLEAYLLGEPGDFLAARADDLSDMYIIRSDIFHKTYEPAEP